jgi:hypothetical protein
VRVLHAIQHSPIVINIIVLFQSVLVFFSKRLRNRETADILFNLPDPAVICISVKSPATNLLTSLRMAVNTFCRSVRLSISLEISVLLAIEFFLLDTPMPNHAAAYLGAYLINFIYKPSRGLVKKTDQPTVLSRSYTISSGY